MPRGRRPSEPQFGASTEADAGQLTLIGLLATLVGAGWLLFGIDPNNQRHSDNGMLHPGCGTRGCCPRFIRNQQRPTLLVVIGGAVQVVGGVLALIAAGT